MVFKKTVSLFLFLLLPATGIAQVKLELDELTQLKNWTLKQLHFELQLVQRTPDQTRGFFQGRGFSRENANDIATQCVLQTIIKNKSMDSSGPGISVSLKKWRIKVNGGLQGLKLKEDWAKQWQLIENDSFKVSKSAQIAFRWATFPSEQTFESKGDYNWGMISFGLKPETKFDLHVFWEIKGQLYNEWVKNLECPKDV